MKPPSRNNARDHLLLLALGYLLACSCPGIAAASFGTLTLYLENDIFAGTDRQYTHGCGFSWISSDFARDRPAPVWSRPLFGLLATMGFSGSRRNASLAIRQNIYTPDDIKETDRLPNDRPYAGVTYLVLGCHQGGPDALTSLNLDVGIIGPHSYAATSQETIHRWIDSPAPKGWDYQLQDEMILNLAVERRWRLHQIRNRRGWGFDLLPHAGIDMGNMTTAANAGAQIRLGWRLPRNYGTYIIEPGCECQLPRGPDHSGSAYPRFGAHLIVMTKGEWVLHDIFLDGNTFRTGPSVDKYPLRGSGSVGMSVQVDRLRLEFVVDFLTKQFHTEDVGEAFGGLTVSVYL